MHRKTPFSTAKQFLSAAMLAAPLTLAAYGIGAAVIKPFVIMATESPATPLTAGEKGMLTAIFQDQLDVNAMRIHRSEPNVKKWEGKHVGGFAATTIPGRQNHIYMTPSHYAEDYSKIPDTIDEYFKFFAFMHESTHIWQGALYNIRHTAFCDLDNGKLANRYRYTLKDGKKFSEYCAEQQAQIVAAYATLFFKPDLIRKYPDLVPTGNYREKLKTVVEEQFPHARLAREKIEALGTTPAWDASGPMIPQS